MHVPRLYVPDQLTTGIVIALDEAQKHHIRDVLRLKLGESIIVFNGTGGEYHGIISDLEKRSVKVELQSFQPIARESNLHCHLLPALIGQERLSWTIQKAVELGVNEITPIITSYTNKKLSKEKQEKRREQFRKIAIAACEQSGRDTIPIIHPINSLDEQLENKQSLIVACHPFSPHKIKNLTPSPRISLLIGPEGGFSPEEIRLFGQNDIQTVSLSPRILRAETAAITALALLQTYFGDL